MFSSWQRKITRLVHNVFGKLTSGFTIMHMSRVYFAKLTL